MKYNRNVYQALTMIMQFGINMLVPIFLCSFAGMFLDRRFGTSFWTVLLFFVGTLAGFTNVFRFAKRIYETPAVTRRRPGTPACGGSGDTSGDAVQKSRGRQDAQKSGGQDAQKRGGI